MLVSFDSFKTTLNVIFNRLSATEKKLDVFEEDTTKNIDVLVEARPDWAQNDSKQLDYIKNRPFFDSEPISTGTIDEDKCSGIYGNSLDETLGGYTSIYYSGCMKATTLISGKNYTVVFNGIPYYLTFNVRDLNMSGDPQYSCEFVVPGVFRLFRREYYSPPSSVNEELNVLHLADKHNISLPVTFEIYEGLAIDPKYIPWTHDYLYHKEIFLSDEQKERAVSNIGAQKALDVSAAATGQVLRVKSVNTDGVPTEWEAADYLNKDDLNSVRDDVDTKLDAMSDEVDVKLGEKQDKITSYIIITDSVNSCEYIVRMEDGSLVSMCRATGIVVEEYPTNYIGNGDEVTLDGVAVVATCQDGTTRKITPKSYSPTVVTADTTQIDVEYEELGEVFTTNFPVSVLPISEAELVDFNYIINDDKTITITGWKQTLDGTTSTKMVVPDSDAIYI